MMWTSESKVFSLKKHVQITSLHTFLCLNEAYSDYCVHTSYILLASERKALLSKYDTNEMLADLLPKKAFTLMKNI